MDSVRPGASAAALVTLAGEFGMTVAQCLRGSGLTPATLDRPDGEVRAAQELAVVTNIVGALGHVPGLGLEAGKRHDMTTYGIYSFAVVSSPTVRQAFRIGVDYMEIGYSLARWRFVEDDAGGVVTLDYSELPAATRIFLLERDIASIATLDREIFGTLIAPDAVELACPAPDYAHLFTELLTFAPVFDAPHTRIALSRDVLDLPLPQGNPHVAALAEQQAAAILQRRRARQGIGERVRAVLLAEGVDAAQDAVAAALNLSVRTLRRRLDAEGTSYRELVSETRQMLAEELLAIGATVEDIADRLGYADASSFTHAFQRWTGTSPGRFARTVR